MLEDFLIEVRGRYDATNGFGEPRMYVSYAHGDESQDVVYGKRKLDRLRALKKKWDPKGAFSFNVPIAV